MCVCVFVCVYTSTSHSLYPSLSLSLSLSGSAFFNHHIQSITGAERRLIDRSQHFQIDYYSISMLPVSVIIMNRHALGDPCTQTIDNYFSGCRRAMQNHHKLTNLYLLMHSNTSGFTLAGLLTPLSKKATNSIHRHHEIVIS